MSTESRLNRLALEPWRLDTAVSSCRPMRVTRVALIYSAIHDWYSTLFCYVEIPRVASAHFRFSSTLLSHCSS